MLSRNYDFTSGLFAVIMNGFELCFDFSQIFRQKICFTAKPAFAARHIFHEQHPAIAFVGILTDGVFKIAVSTKMANIHWEPLS